MAFCPSVHPAEALAEELCHETVWPALFLHPYKQFQSVHIWVLVGGEESHHELGIVRNKA